MNNNEFKNKYPIKITFMKSFLEPVVIIRSKDGLLGSLICLEHSCHIYKKNDKELLKRHSTSITDTNGDTFDYIPVDTFRKLTSDKYPNEIFWQYFDKEVLPTLSKIPSIVYDCPAESDCNDCAVRAITLATGKKYDDVYDDLTKLAAKYDEKEIDIRKEGTSTEAVIEYLRNLGWIKHSIYMRGGLEMRDLPTKGICIAQAVWNDVYFDKPDVTRQHITMMKDGIIHDIFDATVGNVARVYDYWTEPEVSK